MNLTTIPGKYQYSTEHNKIDKNGSETKWKWVSEWKHNVNETESE